MSTLIAETRRASPIDAISISDVHSYSWQHAYAGVIPHGALARMINRRGVKWWETAIKRSTIILVIEIGNEIAGYATLGPNRVSTFPQQGEIYEIYLKPEYQGIGLGTKLFGDARKELQRRGYKGLAVWVLSENENAISFYQNAGGKKIATGSEHFDNQKLEKLAFSWD
ncbi:MAG: GNAT family N-acetyltransferase [Pseudomonadota bacterium]